ncbi:hypothetical protein [Winogradskyella poriferorum]|uniref:DUF3828 domain-containing protein n=1 Tax=Winogradskyella poriferorum TaxID=307627 RepID=A0ABU7W5K7_9FLAO
MKFILVFIFCFLSFLSYAQIDTLSILHKNIWTPKKHIYTHWLERDTINLKSLKYYKKIEDSIFKKEDLSQEDINDLIASVRFENEKIKFDSINNLKHILYMSCPVGATMYNLKSLKYKNGQVDLNYSVRNWSQNEKTKHYSFNYKVIIWNDDEILLSRIKI